MTGFWLVVAVLAVAALVILLATALAEARQAADESAVLLADTETDLRTTRAELAHARRTIAVLLDKAARDQAERDRVWSRALEREAERASDRAEVA